MKRSRRRVRMMSVKCMSHSSVHVLCFGILDLSQLKLKLCLRDMSHLDMSHLDMSHLDLSKLDLDLSKLDLDLLPQLEPDLLPQLEPDLSQLEPDLSQLEPDLSQLRPQLLLSRKKQLDAILFDNILGKAIGFSLTQFLLEHLLIQHQTSTQ